MAGAQRRATEISLLDNARFEIFPTAAVGDTVCAQLPPGAEVTVTASAEKGLEPTLALSERLADEGYALVPHLAARMISGRSELEEILARLAAVGITRVFVPGGDADPPVGDYPDALSLLQELAGIDHGLAQIGIAGFPESHPFIPDDATAQALVDKDPYATQIVTNLCMDSRTVIAWARSLRSRGIVAPVLVGMPGPVSRAKLLAMATHIGARDSVRFLSKNSRLFGRIFTPGGYSPGRYLEQIASAAGDRGPVVGLHLYTFNQLGAAERWRREERERRER